MLPLLSGIVHPLRSKVLYGVFLFTYTWVARAQVRASLLTVLLW